MTWGPKIETGNNPLPQLYNMIESKTETNNVANQYPEVVYELQNVLRRERAKTIKE